MLIVVEDHPVTEPPGFVGDWLEPERVGLVSYDDSVLDVDPPVFVCPICAAWWALHRRLVVNGHWARDGSLARASGSPGEVAS